MTRPVARSWASYAALLDAMDDFVEWALAEWGEPTEAEAARAEEIWSKRCSSTPASSSRSRTRRRDALS